jgi:SAM-dependent methyltransferase
MVFCAPAIDQSRFARDAVRWLIASATKRSSPVRAAINSLSLQADDAVVELGCGPNKAMSLLATRGRHGVVYGVDLCPSRLEHTLRYNQSGVQQGVIRLYRASFKRLPFATGSIDKIIGVDGIHSWEDPIAVAVEMRRVLRRDGRAAIYAPETAWDRQWHFAGPDAFRMSSALELTQFLQLGGFDPDRILVQAVEGRGGRRGLLATISP